MMGVALTDTVLEDGLVELLPVLREEKGLHDEQGHDVGEEDDEGDGTHGPLEPSSRDQLAEDDGIYDTAWYERLSASDGPWAVLGGEGLYLAHCRLLPRRSPCPSAWSSRSRWR